MSELEDALSETIALTLACLARRKAGGKAYFTTPYALGQYLLMDYMSRKTKQIHWAQTREEASREAPQKSEMENDAGGEPEVVLRFPEKTGVQTVCLNTPCNSLPKAIIKTSAYGPRARSVRKIG